MNIFVSYTARNNEVSKNSLISFSNKLKSFGRVFIDLLDNDSFDKQERIIKELERSNMLVLIESQSTYKSEWVRFELNCANKLDIPVVEFKISEVDSLTREAIGNKFLTLLTIQPSRQQRFTNSRVVR